MNSLQRRKTSGLHARRCAKLPSSDSADPAVADMQPLEFVYRLGRSDFGSVLAAPSFSNFVRRPRDYDLRTSFNDSATFVAMADVVTTPRDRVLSKPAKYK